ncbi:uncharacterized protein E0L32_003922 [Thyridium curvatum]|uniref:ATP-grasp domain-containing protein n=1 Tax=Thyridium curvatum TaxID=1093900 RepID=A0A507B9B1_9PEZI|nr:uncharacterized protein E0L32_003922 [Thyridium curvatum]TPX16273.1 hypothetical protein E0L32_003922 [Thyridium curvatum]
MLHEKDLFMRHCRQIQLPIPETYSVESADQTLDILRVAAASNPNHRFILKTVGVDDAHRGDMSLLPLGSDEETARHVTRLPISRHNPWILQRYIAGNEEFCTHAVVMKGDVKVFVACQSAELLMHYRALPAEDDMTRTMLHFTREFLKRSPGVEDWTGHLSFDFMAEKVATGNGQTRRLYAIECNPRAHTAVVLFAQRGREMRDMVQAYLSALDGETFPKTNGVSDAPIPESNNLSAVYPPADALPRYWIGHDLVTLWLLPTYKLFIREQEPSKYLRVVLELLKHILWWKDGTFEIWDPLPFMHLYHTYWAGTLWNAWMQGINWSRLNVSTTKMFLCD